MVDNAEGLAFGIHLTSLVFRPSSASLVHSSPRRVEPFSLLHFRAAKTLTYCTESAHLLSLRESSSACSSVSNAGKFPLVLPAMCFSSLQWATRKALWSACFNHGFAQATGFK
ncbi:MAG: hypothetical protein ACJAZO_004091 [Myxococcota bacterium]|jgi:hypothetical protein